MDKDFLKYCKYYKGEESNPYVYKDFAKENFWGFEHAFCAFSTENKEGWLQEAKTALKTNPDEYAFLKKDNVKPDTYGLVYYIYTMLCKWCPMDVDIINQY